MLYIFPFLLKVRESVLALGRVRVREAALTLILSEIVALRVMFVFWLNVWLFAKVKVMPGPGSKRCHA